MLSHTLQWQVVVVAVRAAPTVVVGVEPEAY
jgi:hypothetical protein